MRTARSGSGGVCIYVKLFLLNSYNVVDIDMSFDGILSFKLINKFSQYEIFICSCYLPPEGSERGKDASAFFSPLLNLSYLNSDADLSIFCGDVNSRIGSQQDIIIDVDDIDSRVSIDTVSNKHGSQFIEFLKESKMCILNGRVFKENDNFTSVSTKGKSVEDYIFIPHSNLSNISHFKVHCVTALINELNIVPDRAMPDHSVVSCRVKINYDSNGGTNEFNRQQNNENEQNDINSFKRKYRVDDIPETFMCSEAMNQQIEHTIQCIQESENSQRAINDIYKSIVQLYQNGMAQKLKPIHRVKQNRHLLKPWWNDNLAQIRHNVCEAEKQYLVCNIGNKGLKSRLRSSYKDIQNNFDKELRKAKRIYQKSVRNELIHFETNDPKHFWNVIKNLGPKRKTDSIPMEVINDDGSFSTNKDDVYKKWMGEFQNLFSKCQNNDFNEEFMDDILALKQEFEDSNPREIPNIPNFEAFNADLNKNIEVDEILTVISNAKKGKSFGIDMLPNEVFFNANSVLLIHTLFEKCFESSILPDTWSESVIKPIPKNKTNDLRIPLNYRGISIIPTMCKLFSMVLNNRLTKVVESLDMVCDEQNGFRKTRACIDHLYVLTTIIKNRRVHVHLHVWSILPRPSIKRTGKCCSLNY